MEWIEADALYEDVKQRGRLASNRDAAAGVKDVLSSMVPLLGDDEIRGLVAQLPVELTNALARARGIPDNLIDREVFIGRLVNHMDTEYGYDESLGGLDLSSAYADDDAITRTQAVFGALKEFLDAETANGLRSRLPNEVQDWWDRA